MPVCAHSSVTATVVCITSLIPAPSTLCAARLRYNGPLIELVLYGGNAFDSSWWPLDHESTFNDLVNVADGCKVPMPRVTIPPHPPRLGITQRFVILALGDLQECVWRFGNQPLEVARRANAVVFHAPHSERFGWGIDAWRTCLGSANRPAHQTWAMLTMESRANVDYDALLPHMNDVFSHNMHTSHVTSPELPTSNPFLDDAAQVPVLYSNRVWRYR